MGRLIISHSGRCTHTHTHICTLSPCSTRFVRCVNTPHTLTPRHPQPPSHPFNTHRHTHTRIHTHYQSPCTSIHTHTQIHTHTHSIMHVRCAYTNPQAATIHIYT